MDKKAFVDALLALCAEHNVMLGGCGCCSSPYIVSADGKTFLLSDLKIYPDGRYRYFDDEKTDTETNYDDG